MTNKLRAIGTVDRNGLNITGLDQELAKEHFEIGSIEWRWNEQDGSQLTTHYSCDECGHNIPIQFLGSYCPVCEGIKPTQTQDI